MSDWIDQSSMTAFNFADFVFQYIYILNLLANVDRNQIKLVIFQNKS